jgi:hypothetical protein
VINRVSAETYVRTEMTPEEFYKRLTFIARYEGRVEGIAEVVVDLLDQRFGRLPEFVKHRVSKLPVLDLFDVARLLLTAKNLYEALDIGRLRPPPEDAEAEESGEESVGSQPQGS